MGSELDLFVSMDTELVCSSDTFNSGSTAET